MKISSFVLNGAEDRPDYGIHLNDINTLVENLRQQENGQFTLEKLRTVTHAITQYYRNAGFFLARAFIPEQTVENGTVIIEVLEGTLERVIPEGNNWYSEKQLQASFSTLIAQPIHLQTIETNLLYLNDYPGLTTFSVFRPGSKHGSAVLSLSVENERWYDASIAIDNYGSSFTGEYRSLLNFSLNNPTRSADRLSITVLQSLNPVNSTYGAIAYDRPLFSPANRLGFGYSKNTFQVGGYLADLEIAGDSYITNVYYDRSFIRKKNRSLNGQIDLSRKSASNRQAQDDIGQDELTVATGSLTYTGLDQRFAGHNGLTLAIARGFAGLLGAMDANGDGKSSRTGAGGERAGGNFTKLSLQGSRTQYLNFHPRFRNQSLLLNGNVQYSQDLLTSLEQILLGGPNAVRGYPISQAQMDSAYVLSLEWLARTAASSHFNWLSGLQVSAFIDYAKGWLNKALANETDNTTLMGTGFGFKLSIKRDFIARMDVAFPIGGPEPVNNDAFQLFFNLDYHF